MAQAFHITIKPADGGRTISIDRLKKGVARSDEGPHETVVKASAAQIRGIYQYIACIKNGDNTGPVETAINAL